MHKIQEFTHIYVNDVRSESNTSVSDQMKTIISDFEHLRYISNCVPYIAGIDFNLCPIFLE